MCIFVCVCQFKLPVLHDTTSTSTTGASVSAKAIILRILYVHVSNILLKIHTVQIPPASKSLAL